MKLQIDDRELKREIRFAARASSLVYKGAGKQVRKHSLAILRAIKRVMPVDTGAARARWGVAGAPGGIWQATRDSMSIMQGAQLQPFEYIERLNEGSSQQAPAGFIDVIAEEQQYALEIAVGQATEAVLSGVGLGDLNNFLDTPLIPGIEPDPVDE